jgi:hypothetical protein
MREITNRRPRHLVGTWPRQKRYARRIRSPCQPFGKRVAGTEGASIPAGGVAKGPLWEDCRRNWFVLCAPILKLRIQRTDPSIEAVMALGVPWSIAPDSSLALRAERASCNSRRCRSTWLASTTQSAASDPARRSISSSRLENSLLSCIFDG